MSFNDDATQVGELIGVAPISLFENRFAPSSLVFGQYRPLGYLPWALIGEWFGWYVPALLHMLNVWVHVLTTALVAALAIQVARLFRLPALSLAALAGAMFGFLPFAYQAVLWSAAVVHAQVTMFGVAAAWTYLVLPERGSRRVAGLVAVAMLLLAACLSHEQGPNFGLFVLWAEAMRATATRTRLRPGAFALFGLTLAYFLGYRLFLVTDWTSSQSLLAEGSLSELPAKLAYHLQNLLIWPAAALRPLANVDEAGAAPLLLTLAAAGIALAAAALIRAHMVKPGLFALGFWAIGAAPSMLLSQRYLLDGPRLLYPASVGSSLLWALVTVAVWRLARHPVPRAAVAAGWFVALAWSSGFISDRLNEAARLTPAVRRIDADLQQSQPSDRLLLINPPFVNLAVRPSFFLGREGLPIWMYFYATEQTAPLWPGGLSGIMRPTATVRHEISLSNRETNFSAPEFLFTRGGAFRYGVFGVPADDAALRDWILRSNYIYRFDYDPPGFRLTRLGDIRREPGSGTSLASFERGEARIALADARAARCNDRIELDLAWADARGFDEPAAVFVHVADAQGQQIAVADRDPLDGALPLELVPSGAQVRERRTIRNLPQDAAPDLVLVGVYARADGERYTARDAGGSRLDSDQVVIPFEDGSSLCAW